MYWDTEFPNLTAVRKVGSQLVNLGHSRDQFYSDILINSHRVSMEYSLKGCGGRTSSGGSYTNQMKVQTQG
jgi:hypothetical protein